MIFMSIPHLEAEATLDMLFQPAINEDSIYENAMLVYDDEERAKKLVKIYADTKSKP